MGMGQTDRRTGRSTAERAPTVWGGRHNKTQDAVYMAMYW